MHGENLKLMPKNITKDAKKSNVVQFS